MGEQSAIAWTDHTFNPWWGCVRVSPGCEHCYAETFSRRTGHKVWGADQARRWFGEKHWAEPLRWNHRAEKAGIRKRVFCASMADVFEAAGPGREDLAEDLANERARLWATIDSTPALTWQLLTKRPENVMRMVPEAWRSGFPTNVWMLTTAEDQQRADERIPELFKIPARVRGVSYEPALGPIDFSDWLDPLDPGASLQWIIVGGESGHHARPFRLAWARSTVAQCRAAGVPVFVKQLGALPVMSEAEWAGMSPTPLLRHRRYQQVPDETVPLAIGSSKGGDMAEWPEDLRVREFPA